MDFDNFSNIDSNINWRESIFGFAKDDEYEIFCDLCNAVSAIRNVEIKDVLSVHDMDKKTLYMENAAHCKDPSLRILNFMHNNDIDFHAMDKNGNSILHYIDQNKEPIMKQILLNFISKNTLYSGEKLDSSIYNKLKV